MITIRNPSFQPLAVIELYDNDTVDETINGEYKLSFTTLIDPDGKSEYLRDGNLAEVEDQLFNIVHHRRTRTGDGSTMVAVECEQVSYDLLNFEWEAGFVHAGTPFDCLSWCCRVLASPLAPWSSADSYPWIWQREILAPAQS